MNEWEINWLALLLMSLLSLIYQVNLMLLKVRIKSLNYWKEVGGELKMLTRSPVRSSAALEHGGGCRRRAKPWGGGVGGGVSHRRFWGGRGQLPRARHPREERCRLRAPGGAGASGTGGDGILPPPPPPPTARLQGNKRTEMIFKNI